MVEADKGKATRGRSSVGTWVSIPEMKNVGVSSGVNPEGTDQ